MVGYFGQFAFGDFDIIAARVAVFDAQIGNARLFFFFFSIGFQNTIEILLQVTKMV